MKRRAASASRFWLNGPKLNCFRFGKVRRPDRRLRNVRCPTVVPTFFSLAVYCTFKLTIDIVFRVMLVNYFVSLFFHSIQLWGVKFVALKLTNTVIFVLGTETARPIGIRPLIKDKTTKNKNKRLHKNGLKNNHQSIRLTN